MATAATDDAIIKEPIDMLRLSLDDRVYVKCRCVQPISLPPAWSIAVVPILHVDYQQVGLC
jgi:hypothetical protein